MDKVIFYFDNIASWYDTKVKHYQVQEGECNLILEVERILIDNDTNDLIVTAKCPLHNEIIIEYVVRIRK